eukprot:6466751-Amphidinium_carterae.1
MNIPDGWAYLVNSVLHHTTMSISWQGAETQLRVSSGTPEGEPLSPWLFKVGVYCWLAYVQSRGVGMYPCLAFADDMASVLRGIRELLKRLAEFRVLELCTGIALNYYKTEILPVGRLSHVCWKVLLEDSLPPLHEATLIPVVQAVRYLGFRLARGCMHFDWQMVGKLVASASQLTTFQYGSLHNLRYLQILEGMLNYPLAAGEASEELRGAWRIALTRMGISSL